MNEKFRITTYEVIDTNSYDFETEYSIEFTRAKEYNELALKLEQAKTMKDFYSEVLNNTEMVEKLQNLCNEYTDKMNNIDTEINQNARKYYRKKTKLFDKVEYISQSQNRILAQLTAKDEKNKVKSYIEEQLTYSKDDYVYTIGIILEHDKARREIVISLGLIPKSQGHSMDKEISIDDLKMRLKNLKLEELKKIYNRISIRNMEELKVDTSENIISSEYITRNPSISFQQAFESSNIKPAKVELRTETKKSKFKVMTLEEAYNAVGLEIVESTNQENPEGPDGH